MTRTKALLVMTLIARRSSAWAHDIVTGRPGEISEESVRSFSRDIRDALDILNDPTRGSWIESDPDVERPIVEITQ